MRDNSLDFLSFSILIYKMLCFVEGYALSFRKIGTYFH
jgi:hypothetical protein